MGLALRPSLGSQWWASQVSICLNTVLLDFFLKSSKDQARFTGLDLNHIAANFIPRRTQDHWVTLFHPWNRPWGQAPYSTEPWIKGRQLWIQGQLISYLLTPEFLGQDKGCIRSESAGLVLWASWALKPGKRLENHQGHKKKLNHSAWSL